MLFWLSRSISGSESCSILISLAVVSCYNAVWQHGMSQKCQKLPFFAVQNCCFFYFFDIFGKSKWSKKKVFFWHFQDTPSGQTILKMATIAKLRRMEQHSLHEILINKLGLSWAKQWKCRIRLSLSQLGWGLAELGNNGEKFAARVWKGIYPQVLRRSNQLSLNKSIRKVYFV